MFSYLIVVIVLILVALYIILISNWEKLLFYKSTTSERECESLTLMEDCIISYGEYKLLGKKYHSVNETVDNKDVVIVIQGLGGNKTYNHTLIKSLQTVYPHKDFYIFDYPGHGKCKDKKGLSLTIDAIEQIMIWSHQFEDILWVTHCLGTVLLAKALKKRWKSQLHTPSDILIINGFMDPFQYGVRPLPIWFYQYVLCPLLPNYIKDEIQCKEIIVELKNRGCNLWVYQNKNDVYVHVEHGRRLQEVVGKENYYECEKAGSKNYHHMTIDEKNSDLVSFLQKITKK